VIWATQVLESLAKEGLPSRAEVTDAAMSARSECVMLNKGPHIREALRFLTDVSRRMSGHTEKTFARHRRLSVAASDWLAVDRSDLSPSCPERFSTPLPTFSLSRQSGLQKKLPPLCFVLWRLSSLLQLESGSAMGAATAAGPT